MKTHACHMYNIAKPESTSFFLIFLMKICNWNKRNCEYSGALCTWDIPNDADRLTYRRLLRKFFMRNLFWPRGQKCLFCCWMLYQFEFTHRVVKKKTFIADLYFSLIFSFSYAFILRILLNANLKVLNSYN